MPRQIIFAIVTFLHDLFTAVWIGGLITLGLTVLPSARKVLGKGPQMKQLMDGIQDRLSVLVYVSIVGLLVTGLLLSNRSPAFEGLLSFGTPYATALAIKHILTLAMIGIALYRSLVLGRREGPPTPSQEKLSAGLLMLNMVLGILILLLSGFTAAFGTTPPAG
jgi:putative copper export protein